MEILGTILTPALTILLVSLLIPMIAASRYKGDLDAARGKCLRYGDTAILMLRICTALFYLLTLVGIVCTVLSIIAPEMMDVTSDDTAGICVTITLCVAGDIFSTFASISFTRRIYYDGQTFTDIRPFNKQKTYSFAEITDIKITVTGTIGMQPTRQGRLKIYFGEECVKIPAQMYGIAEFISTLRQSRKDIHFD